MEVGVIASILVVDDDPALLRLVALLLRTERYDVEVSNDGNQALQQLQTSRPDAILLDLSMPGDGWTHLLRRRPGRRL